MAYLLLKVLIPATKKVSHPLRTTCNTFLLSKTLHETLLQHLQGKIKIGLKMPKLFR